MARQIVYRLEHSALFPEEKGTTVEEYLSGISRDMILKTGSYFAGFDKNNAAVRNNVEVLSKWFNSDNNNFANEVYKKIKDLEKKNNWETIILNIHTTLKLVEKGFNLKGDDKLTNAEIERKVFKAYVLLNELDNTKDNDILKTLEKVEKSLHWPLLVLVQTFRYADISTANYKEVFDEQMVKAVRFFIFLEQKYPAELKYFLNVYGCKTWQEYIKRVFGLLKAAASNKQGFTELTVKSESDVEFVKKFSFTDETEELKEYDFIPLRSKPLFQVSEDKFRIIFDLFVFEKVFNGIFFTLRSMPGMTLNRAKEIFTFQFSEKTLLYYVLRSIYPDKIKQFSGEQLDKKGFSGAPDYYIRKRNKILLFESKDVVLNGNLKESTSYSIYEGEIKKKLYYDEKDGVKKKKAILQLIENIRKALKNEFKFDRTKRAVRIYPIIVVHHRQLNVAGLNHLINAWFKLELQKLTDEGLNTKKVAPITIVNISTLMFYADTFRLKKPLLENLIDQYHRATRLDETIVANNLENELLRRTYPFSMFAKNTLKGSKQSSILKRSIKHIVTT